MHILLHSNSPEKMLGSNKTMQERLFEFGWEYCIHWKPTFFLAITCAGLFAYRLDHSGPWRNISPISLCSKSNLHNIFLLISYFSYVTIKILFDIVDHSYILSCWCFLGGVPYDIHAFFKFFIQSSYNVPTRNILQFKKNI